MKTDRSGMFTPELRPAISPAKPEETREQKQQKKERQLQRLKNNIYHPKLIAEDAFEKAIKEAMQPVFAEMRKFNKLLLHRVWGTPRKKRLPQAVERLKTTINHPKLPDAVARLSLLKQISKFKKKSLKKVPPQEPKEKLPRFVEQFKTWLRYHHPKVNDEPKISDEQKAAMQQVTEEIVRFNPQQLQKIPVYYAQTNLLTQGTLAAYAGFIVTGMPYPMTKRQRGKVYGLHNDIMHAPFEVTPKIVAKVRRMGLVYGHFRVFSYHMEHLCEAVAELEGEKFLTMDFFLRALVTRLAQKSGHILTDDELELMIQDQDPMLHNIVLMNFFENNHYGAYLPVTVEPTLFQEKLRLFFNGNAVFRETGVSITSLQDTLREQLLYTQYLDERMAIGKSVAAEHKVARLNTVEKEEVTRLKSQWVGHSGYPMSKQSANCNASAASFLQFAQNRQEKTSTLTYQPIPSASRFAIGKDHRIFMHDPLLINECIVELRDYIQQRRGNGDNLWGRLFDLTEEIKIEAAHHMILLLQQKKSFFQFTRVEVERFAAVNQGRLGRIVNKYPQAQKILQDWNDYKLVLRCVDELKQFIRDARAKEHNPELEAQIEATEFMVLLLQKKASFDQLSAEIKYQLSAINNGLTHKIIAKYPVAQKILDEWQLHIIILSCVKELKDCIDGSAGRSRRVGEKMISVLLKQSSFANMTKEELYEFGEVIQFPGLKNIVCKYPDAVRILNGWEQYALKDTPENVARIERPRNSGPSL